jgi:alpha-N-arabinofuranosidase
VTTVPARLSIDPASRIGTVNRRLFGGFVEHLGRHVYTGIYEPDHPTADDQGFRRDVIELVRELGVSTIRYPGGNFVSAYRWEDGVGPRDERPRRLDLAWHSTETNEVGLQEFSEWLERVDSDLMLAVNLGTRGLQEALDLLEYANVPGGTELSECRISHGRKEPYGVTMWCLSKEMDGPWQIGHSSAEAYGVLAAQTARAMRQLDSRIELVACGSSGAGMPTFGQWERTVLAHAYDEVDYISCHAYYEELAGDTRSFLASAVDMDSFIAKVVEAADEVKQLKGSDKAVNISFDEWNVWYFSRFENVDKIEGIDNWPVAPRLLEDEYSVLDAVVFGSLLISLIKHADRVTSASLAQLVNVIAPIMTEPGGPAWRQTTFFPFALTSRLARGQAIDVHLEAGMYTTSAYGEVPLVDAAATHDADDGAAAVFLVNRSQLEAQKVVVDVSRLGDVRIAESHALFHDDTRASNTLTQPDRVGVRELQCTLDGEGRLTLELPPVSWGVVALSCNQEVS